MILGEYDNKDTVWKTPLDASRQVSHILSRLEEGSYRVPAVAFEGDDLTREEKERVLMSLVKDGMARKSSKIPGGGVGAL